MSTSEHFDVIIVGGSIAGCTAATLLGRRGLRVLLVERASDPRAYKKICTHFIQASGTPTLRRLGLEDALARAGAKQNRVETWSPFGWITWPEGAAIGLNVRREVLDPMLRDLATQTPGVTVWLGHSAKAVIEERGRITGLMIASKGAEAREVRAKLVVAADGRQGKLGELAGVPAKSSPHGRFFYFAYYEDLALASGDASIIWFGEPDAAYCFPNDDGKTVVAVMPGKARLPAFRADLEQSFVSMVESLPHGPKLSAARRVSDLLGMIEMPNHVRPAAARGMAFIGDAALTSDPMFGVGCGWALQSAEWLADTVGPALAQASNGHRSELDTALKQYARLHKSQLSQHHRLIADASTGRPFNKLESALFGAASRDEVFCHTFARIASRSAQPVTLFTPVNLARMTRANLFKEPQMKPLAHADCSLKAAGGSPAPVRLQNFVPAWDLADISPFCFKVETYLKLAGISYTTLVGDSRKAPKGKLPVLHDGPQTIADSSAILEHLERTRGKPLDAFLSPHQVAVATAVKAMLEEQLYFVIVYQRWLDDHGWKLYSPVFGTLLGKLGVPRVLHRLLVPQIRKQMLGALHGQGFGRHTPEEIVNIGKRTLDATATLLEGPFFFGERPSTLDATAYAFLQSILGAPFEGPLLEHLRGHTKLRAYCQHVSQHLRAGTGGEPRADALGAGWAVTATTP